MGELLQIDGNHEVLVLLSAAEPWAVYACVDALYDACGRSLEAVSDGAAAPSDTAGFGTVAEHYRQLPSCSTYIWPVTGLPRYDLVTLPASSQTLPNTWISCPCGSTTMVRLASSVGMLLPVRPAVGPPSVSRRVPARCVTIGPFSLVLVTN
jgi:hypothetical protein